MAKIVQRKYIEDDDEADGNLSWEDPDTDDADLVFHVYPTVDDKDGSVQVTDMVGEICCEIEDIAASGNMTPQNLAKYQTITELMATPMCKLTEKMEEMLQIILEEEMEAGYKTLFGDDTATETKEEEKPVETKKPEATVIPPTDEDISDEDLLAEFASLDAKAATTSALAEEWQYCGGYD